MNGAHTVLAFECRDPRSTRQQLAGSPPGQEEKTCSFRKHLKDGFDPCVINGALKTISVN